VKKIKKVVSTFPDGQTDIRESVTVPRGFWKRVVAASNRIEKRVDI
jgi:DNA/RNA endonuclease G (NUC1)